MPKTKDRSHEKTIVRKPSRRVSGVAFFTKMNGNEPTIRVIMKLITNGVKAASIPLITETMIDRNMNNALTSRALPTFMDIDLTFIFKCLDPFLEFDILLHELRNAGIYVGQLVITFKRTAVSMSGLTILVDTV